jgi:hypothetical protein
MIALPLHVFAHDIGPEVRCFRHVKLNKADEPAGYCHSRSVAYAALGYRKIAECESLMAVSLPGVRGNYMEHGSRRRDPKGPT